MNHSPVLYVVMFVIVLMIAWFLYRISSRGSPPLVNFTYIEENGIRRTMVDGTPLPATSVASLQDCEKLCEQHTACLALQYVDAEKTCAQIGGYTSATVSPTGQTIKWKSQKSCPSASGTKPTPSFDLTATPNIMRTQAVTLPLTTPAANELECQRNALAAAQAGSYLWNDGGATAGVTTCTLFKGTGPWTVSDGGGVYDSGIKVSVCA
jgi:hypothetical protein